MIPIAALLLLFPSVGLFSQDAVNSDIIRRISLEAELKRGFLGLPEGMNEPGREAYISFADNSATYREWGSPAPSDWELKFTYTVRDVSMGPMGEHPVPYFMMESNKSAGTVFYIEDYSGKELTEYEFPVGKKLSYETPEEPFLFKTADGRRIRLLFTQLTGENDDGLLFSAVFMYSEF